MRLQKARISLRIQASIPAVCHLLPRAAPDARASRSGVWPSTTYTHETALHGLQTCPPRRSPPPTFPAPPGPWLPKDPPEEGQSITWAPRPHPGLCRPGTAKVSSRWSRPPRPAGRKAGLGSGKGVHPQEHVSRPQTRT